MNETTRFCRNRGYDMGGDDDDGDTNMEWKDRRVGVVWSVRVACVQL
jgi:hypothetical protein